MRPSREVQINRALSLLDRIITLLEMESQERTDLATAAAKPKLSTEQIERISIRSRYWKDDAVREAILSMYGRTSARDAAAILLAEFGTERAPSKSAIARLFISIAERSGER